MQVFSSFVSCLVYQSAQETQIKEEKGAPIQTQLVHGVFSISLGGFKGEH